MTDGAANRMALLVAGIVLLVLGVVVVGAGEWQRSGAQRAVDAAGGRIIQMGPDTDVQDLDGRLVWARGTLQVAHPIGDRDFGIVVDTPKLIRKVEMQQWREVDDGQGGVRYVRDWYDQPIDSSRFQRPERHQNPPFSFYSRVFRGVAPTLHGLSLAPQIEQALPRREAIPPRLSTLPANLVASFRLADGKLWTSTHPGSPRIGDLRVSWKKQPLAEVTILARVQDGQLVPSSDLPAPGYLAMVGTVSLEHSPILRPELPHMTWVWRILGMLLALAGAWLAFRAWRDRIPNPLVPVACAVLPVGLVAGACWIGTRGLPWLVWWLLAVVAVIALVGWRLRPAWFGEGE